MSPSTKYAALALIVVASIVASKYQAQSYWGARVPLPTTNINGLVESAPWLRDVELTHAADQYDCLDSATKQLAAQLAAFIQDRQSQFQEPVLVRVRCEGECSLSDFRARTNASLKSYLPQALLDADPKLNVQLSSSTETSVQQDSHEGHCIDLRLTTQSIGLDNTPNSSSDTFLLAGSIEFDQQVTNLKPLQVAGKDWIGQWAAYRDGSTHKHLQQYRAESLDEAQMLVARELAHKWHSQRSHNRFVSGLSQNQAAEIIQRELPRLGLIVDQFEQTFQLTLQDGTQLPALTRSALLIDQSPLKLDAVQATLDSSYHRRAQQFWSRLGLLCPIALVLIILTLGLDQLTLGYYTWRIRSGAVLIASVIFLLLV
jgi:hypothetical protein